MMELGATLSIPVPRETVLIRRGGLFIKSESTQWTGSAKYRMVYAKVVEAVRKGEISERSILAEVTSGSTGVALAHVGHLLGVRVELHVYETLPPQKKRAMEDIGARLVAYPPSVSVGEMLDQVRSQAGVGACWHLDQYDRESTIAAYQGLAEELIDQIRTERDAAPLRFVCPVGTGGLIQSIGGALRAEFPGIRIVALEPQVGSSIDGIRNTSVVTLGRHDPYEITFPDEVHYVDKPRGTIWAAGTSFGESSTAAYLLAVAKGWTRTIVLAPD